MLKKREGKGLLFFLKINWEKGRFQIGERQWETIKNRKNRQRLLLTCCAIIGSRQESAEKRKDDDQK